MAKKKEAPASPFVPAEEQPYKIPANWCWTRMQNIAQWSSGGTPSRKNPLYYQGTIPWIKTGELNDDYIFETEEHISDDAIAHSSAKLFPVHTIAIAMYGATIGKVGILGIEATTNQACACGVASPAIYFKYLFYYACSEKDNFVKLGKGGAQPNISQEIIKVHEIPLPPLPEQQRIVSRIESLFSKLDEAKEKAQAVVDSFEFRKFAILHKAFTGKLTEKWRKANGMGLDSWQEISLKNVITLLSGQDFSPEKYNSSQIGLPYITGASNFEKNHVLINRWTQTPTVIAQTGDVLLVCKGSGFGKVIIADFSEAHIARQIMALRPHKEIYNRFLYYFLQYQYEHIKDSGQGLIPGIGRKVVLEMQINLPVIKEQREFVKVLDNLLEQEQQAKKAAEAVLTQIDTMKKAILARAFRGKLGTNDSAEESAAELVQKELKSGAPKQPRAKAVFIPEELETQLKSEVERKIIKLYLKNGSEVLAIEVLMAVSSKKFEVMDALRSLEQRKIIKKLNNGNYSLVR